MRKMKRFISLAMVLVLALSMAPAAHAAEYEYAVNGGNLYFDPTTGTITNCDSSVYSADIPEEIYGIPVVEIGKDAFAECRKLVSVTIPSSVTTIGDRAFSSCESLKSIVIPDSVTKLGGSTVQSVFAYCISLESATIPGSIRKLDGYLFADCERLSSITLGEGIEVIKRGFVIRCDSLEEIVLPDSVEEIQSRAFLHCRGLESVTFGKNLEFIAAEAFPACTNLKSAYFTGDAPGTGAGGNIFSSGSNIIVYYPEGASGWDTTWNGYITQAYTLESDEPAPAPVEPAQPVESTQPSISTGNNPFTDVPTGSYYYDAVLWALENGITDGVSADKFQPNATCTRGQVVTFLWRSKGCPEPVIKTNPFTDVKASSPFYKAILWAYENGITTGDTDTTFNPDGTCTSAHVVTFLWRAKGKPFASGASALANTYPNAYYTDAVAWADSDGLLYGTSSAFAPDALSPRADIVTYLYRDAI